MFGQQVRQNVWSTGKIKRLVNKYGKTFGQQVQHQQQDWWGESRWLGVLPTTRPRPVPGKGRSEATLFFTVAKPTDCCLNLNI